MIQVELNGKLTEVSKHQLFALAKRGEIGQETRIVVDGKESKAGKVKGLEFGKESVSEPPAGQDRLAQYKQKHYGQAQESPKQQLPVPPPVSYSSAASNDAFADTVLQEWKKEQDEMRQQDQVNAMSEMPYTPPPDKYCIACGAPLVAFAAFCSSCGTPSNPAGVQQSGLQDEQTMVYQATSNVPRLSTPTFGCFTKALIWCFCLFIGFVILIAIIDPSDSNSPSRPRSVKRMTRPMPKPVLLMRTTESKTE